MPLPKKKEELKFKDWLEKKKKNLNMKTGLKKWKMSSPLSQQGGCTCL